MPEKRWWRQSHPALWVQGVCLLVAIGAFTTPGPGPPGLVPAYAEGASSTRKASLSQHADASGENPGPDQKTGKELLTGQTDDQGKFPLKSPPRPRRKGWI
jgi:hypothetical protein